ncbi:hypothetical protein GCM10010404_69530 [Nonomuraea africana]|uniref:ABC-type spermidine/putrescine transport system permease subunit II n=1 Tax=Nonomuraea africana TaxID=46171 RepID=A0ABR9K6Z3_9ACTN|nr:hypothetical protein [Nonomuraea africana]MBE1557777.1 ABC-type spermidine/putrescine transport system permease subunit II [Nonomuraea africana]
MYWAVESALPAAGAVQLSEAAATCGASPAQTLARVIVPAIRGFRVDPDHVQVFPQNP